jgi:uncharacterized protein (TIGR02246 family)
MELKKFWISLGLALVATVSWAADTKAIEQAVRDCDTQMSDAAAAKDADKIVSYYSEDAIVLPPNAAALTNKEAIRETWTELVASPDLKISWNTTRVEVSKSGDMAYASGTYELTTNDKSGKPVKDSGKYLEVWEKQKDGTWKCGADMWNSDLPLPTTKR